VQFLEHLLCLGGLIKATVLSILLEQALARDSSLAVLRPGSVSAKSPMHSSSRDRLAEIGFCHSVLEECIVLLATVDSSGEEGRWILADSVPISPPESCFGIGLPSSGLKEKLAAPVRLIDEILPVQ
jgi:hypothetical protein